MTDHPTASEITDDELDALREANRYGLTAIQTAERLQRQLTAAEADRDRLSASVSWHRATLVAAREAITAAGHGRAQVSDWPDVMPALNDLIAERDYLRSDAPEQDRDRARRVAVALENELAEATAAIDRVRALHTPEPDGTGGQVCGVCCIGTWDCESFPWPCDTIQRLDGEQTEPEA